ncbi:MAG: hypothetical protein J3Q66DRAFT_322505 [Benniella sp.]|nr:MAG: hypothetical protein J3Q66DRAFT_322505 [Benniella sp.]
MDCLPFIRRPFDTWKVTAMRQGFVIISVAILIAFAVNRITYVWEQDYIFRTKIILLEKDIQHIPDIAFCVTNATVSYKDDEMDYKSFLLKDPSMPPGFKFESLCDYRLYDTMIVVWMKSAITKLRKKDTFMRTIGFSTNGNNTIQFTLIPHSENPFRESEHVPVASGLENEYDDMINTHYAQPNTTSYITIAPRILKYLRGDFWGFFNMHNETTETVISSMVEDLNTPGVTEFQVMIPASWELSDELLLLSIPEAFASWGGVFSLVVTIFYLLFGRGRPSPFGVMQKYFFDEGTRKRIKVLYGDSDKKDKDVDGKEGNAELGAQSGTPHDEQALGNFRLCGRLKAGRHSGPTSNSNEGPGMPSTSGKATSMASWEEILTPEQLQKRLDEIESRLAKQQELIKGMFLNMQLVDDALENTTQTSWIRQLFRRGDVQKDNEEKKIGI